MMDISNATRESAERTQERGNLKDDFDLKPEEKSQEIAEDERFWFGNDERFPSGLKRSFNDNYLANSKKRRKQLKPIKIASNIEKKEEDEEEEEKEMVKVPKQIVGLNNDLGDLDDLSHTVPKRLSPLLTHVHNENPLPSETSAGRKGKEPLAAIDTLRLIETPEVAADVNVLNVEMGPNYMTNPHFMFPLSLQPVKNAPPGFWSEASFKIFNQEAYCELCKKEFCNKYFLKTHKANKHGIYVDVAPSSAAKVTAKLEPKDVSPSGVLKANENGKIPGDGEYATAYCDLCNRKFCNKYFVRRHKIKSHGLAEEDVQSLPFHETESSIVQSSSNHSTKENDSLILDAHEPLALVSKENDADNQKKEECTENEEQESPLNLIVVAKESGEDAREEAKIRENSEEEEEDEEDECSSENIEKLQTMLLRLNPSDLESKAHGSCNEIEGSIIDKRDKEYLCDANDSSSDSKGEISSLGKLENLEYMRGSKFESLKQTKPTSSYCEICNKELCNKYFMRTHMQRMHGIEIEHGTQIGGVVCNICNKELCSKYFLRVHKQNTHGITSPNSLMMGPSTSGNISGQKSDGKVSRSDARFPLNNFTQACYLCGKRFRSPKWLQTHFLSDHAEESRDLNEDLAAEDDEFSAKTGKATSRSPKRSKESPENSSANPENSAAAENVDVISKIFWENSAPSKMFGCSQCPFTTSVLAFLFVHERSHFVLAAQEHSEAVKPSISLQNLIHDKTFWQHKITQQVPECLDLSSGKSKFISLEHNGS